MFLVADAQAEDDPGGMQSSKQLGSGGRSKQAVADSSYPGGVACLRGRVGRVSEHEEIGIEYLPCPGGGRYALKFPSVPQQHCNLLVFKCSSNKMPTAWLLSRTLDQACQAAELERQNWAL